MNNLFITLEVPELNSHYAQNLQQLVLNINSNFAKIASLPFLKGDSGVSIETYDEPLYIVEEGGTKVYTDFGKSVIKAIYGVDSFPTDEFTINGIHSYDDLMNVQYIPVFYDRVQGLKYLTVPFMFHDARKNELGMIIGDDISESFEDMSTFILGKMVRNSGTGEAEWLLERHNFEPKLYYNTETQKFCWAIGSQKTDIIAQGVEGQAGQSVYAKYCQGGFNGEDRTYIYINKVLNEDNLQDIVDGSGTINDGFVSIDGTNLSVGDFVMVLYNKEVDGGTIEDLSFGKVMEVGGSMCIPYIEGTTIYNTTQNVTLKALLDNIGKTAEGTTTTPNVRGLYVYGETEQSAQNNNRTPRTPHMLWVDGDGVARLSKLKTDRTDSEGNYVNQTTQNSPEVDGNGVLQVDYNMLKAKTIDTNLYTHSGDFINHPKIQSFGSDTEDKFDLSHTVAKFASSNTNLYYVPNMIVSYTEPTANVKEIGSIDIGGTVDVGKNDVGNLNTQTVEDKLEVIIPSSSTTPSILTNIQINKGGTFEFELPHLGLIDNNDPSSLLNSKQFIRNVDGNPTPIKVVLEKTELNNNDPDSTNKHLKNNTSYGWRHYLDMSLMASPTNNTIYAGTNSSILKLDYEGKVYKANIKYTVVQYEVGYNNYGELDFYKGTWMGNNTKITKTDGLKTSIISYTLDGEPRYNIDLSKPEVVETHRSQWYEKATATDTNIPKFHKYTVKNNDYYDGDVNKGKITLFVPYNIVPENNSLLQTLFECEKVDNVAVEYKRKSLNNGRQFKYRTTVTDVIHYILPVPSQYLGTDIDIYNKLNLGESDYACMRYRLFFKGKANDLVENVENIYINPLNEPLTYEADGLVAQLTKTNNVEDNDKYTQNMVGQNGEDLSKGYVFYPLLNNTKTQYKNLFIVRKNSTNIVGITDEFNSSSRTSTIKYTLDTATELFTNNFGKYNDFCWVFGSLTTDTPQPKTGLGSGHLLPKLAQPQEYKWMIRLGDEKFQIPAAYSYIYSTAKRDDSKEVNKLSTNLNQADYKGIGIYKNESSTQPSTQIKYVSAMDDGWYINKRKIVTESVLTEARKIYNYDDSLLIPNTGSGNGSGSGGSAVTPRE